MYCIMIRPAGPYINESWAVRPEARPSVAVSAGTASSKLFEQSPSQGVAPFEDLVAACIMAPFEGFAASCVEAPFKDSAGCTGSAAAADSSSIWEGGGTSMLVGAGGCGFDFHDDSNNRLCGGRRHDFSAPKMPQSISMFKACDSRHGCSIRGIAFQGAHSAVP